MDLRGQGVKMVLHLCGLGGVWTSQPSCAVARRAFLEWHEQGQVGEEGFGLGGLQVVEVEPGVWAANLIVCSELGEVRYGALETALHKLLRACLERGASVHLMRRHDLGDWERIAWLFDKMLVGPGTPVFVYEE